MRATNHCTTFFQPGDLVCYDAEFYGLVLSYKQGEYFVVKWLEDGEEVVYTYDDIQWKHMRNAFVLVSPAPTE